jgi:O-antigen/teichoic acid export membrane protein
MLKLNHSYRRFLGNSAALLTGRLVAQALGFLFTLLLARRLGAAGLGQFSYLSTILFAGNVATTFGLDTLLIRAAARDGADVTLLARQTLKLQMLLVLLFAGLIAISQPLLLSRTAAPAAALWLYLPALLPLALGTVCSALLRGWERMEFHLLYTMVGQLGQLLAGGLLLIWPLSLPPLMLLLTLTQVLAAAAAYQLCRQTEPGFSLRGWSQAANLSKLLRQAWPLAALAVLALFYQRLGILALSWYRDDAAVGQFAAAGRLLEGAKLLPYALFGALFPRLSQSGGVWPPAWRRLFRLLFAGMIILMLGLIWLGPVALKLLFGIEFEPAGPTLQILALSLPAFLLTLRLSFTLVTANQEHHALRAMAASLLLAITLCLPLTATHGITGTAWATVLAEWGQVALLLLTRPR